MTSTKELARIAAQFKGTMGGDTVIGLVREMRLLKDLVKAQEELLSRYRLGTHHGVDGILDRMAIAKEGLGWGHDSRESGKKL